MKKLAFLGGAGALSLMALLAPTVMAADHLDSPSINSNPMADINDVYAWMTGDAAKVNLALTVSPADDGTRSFGTSVQYVFHVYSRPGFLMSGLESKVICTFTSNTAGKCWVVNADNKVVDYVEGDLSGAAGKPSNSGKFRVFAGRRSDPFFFNLSGFRTAVRTVKQAALTQFNAAGCPTFTTGTTPATLRTQLQAMPTSSTDNGPCGTTNKDCFIDFNVMAIVVQVDKDLVLNGTNKLLTVWASTHMTP